MVCVPVPNAPHLDKYLAQSSGPTILVKWRSVITIGVNAVTSVKTNLEVAQTTAGHYFGIDIERHLSMTRDTQLY